MMAAWQAERFRTARRKTSIWLSRGSCERHRAHTPGTSADGLAVSDVPKIGPSNAARILSMRQKRALRQTLTSNLSKKKAGSLPQGPVEIGHSGFESAVHLIHPSSQSEGVRGIARLAVSDASSWKDRSGRSSAGFSSDGEAQSYDSASPKSNERRQWEQPMRKHTCARFAPDSSARLAACLRWAAIYDSNVEFDLRTEREAGFHFVRSAVAWSARQSPVFICRKPFNFRSRLPCVANLLMPAG